MKISITPEVAEILKRAQFGADRVKLTEQLDRKTYQAVMKVLDAQGGRWNRKEACHLFTVDPREIFAEALETGEIVHRKKSTQAFYTPPEVVRTVLAYSGIESGQRVLEPSAGMGAFADPLKDMGARVTCIESDAEACAHLRQRHSVNFRDFLDIFPDEFEPFDFVVMNPPFTRGQDVAHVQHALGFLKPGGHLLAIMAASFEFNDQRPYRIFREIMAEKGSTLERFDNHEFRASGTDVNTRLIRLIS